MTDFFSIPKVSQLFSNSSGLERKPVAKIHYNFECKFAQRTQHMCCQISTTNRVFLTLHWARKEQKRDFNFYFQFCSRLFYRKNPRNLLISGHIFYIIIFDLYAVFKITQSEESKKVILFMRRHHWLLSMRGYNELATNVLTSQ